MKTSKSPKNVKNDEPQIIDKKQLEEDPWIREYVAEMMKPVAQVSKKGQIPEKTEKADK